MPIVTVEEISGYAHCNRQARKHDPCYPQQEVSALRETVAYTYGDSWGALGPSLTPHDVALTNITEREVVSVRFTDPDDAVCPYCGGPREITDQVRPEYPALSGVPQDELIVRQERATEAAAATASAAERQALALEQLVLQGERGPEIDQLREVIAQQQAQIDRLLATVASEPANGDVNEPTNGQEATPAKPRRAARET